MIFHNCNNILRSASRSEKNPRELFPPHRRVALAGDIVATVRVKPRDLKESSYLTELFVSMFGAL